MVKQTTILLVIFCLNSCQVSTSNLPTKTYETYITLFPSAEVSNWKKIGYLYEVQFQSGGIEHFAAIDPDGILTSLKSQIKADQLPLQISDAILREYWDWDKSSYYVICKGEKLFFQIRLEKEGEKINAIYAQDGITKRIEIIDHSNNL